jgi:D-alanyl-D-alanine carboxypeptidase/D-alanyl-D-alanine-endopeptidase (penicillin-binding protein 4)
MIPPHAASLALIALLLASPAGAAAPLPPRIVQVLHSQGIPATATSIVVTDTATGATLLELNRDTPRAPASAIKVLTTYAALARLGPSYHWTTRAYTTSAVVAGRLAGDLVLQGGGDPSMSAERWWRFAQELRNRGLRHIDGDIVIDRALYGTQEGDPDEFDGRGWRTYNVLPDALLVGLQTADFHALADGGHARIIVDPEPANLHLDNAVRLGSGPCAQSMQALKFTAAAAAPDRIRVEGRVAPGCPADARRAIMRAADFAFGTFVTYWRQLGGDITGTLRLAPTPPGARLLLEYESLPLGDVIRQVNKHSSNPMARMLLLTMGLEQSGPPATVEAGDRAVAAWLASEGMHFPELVLDNGSGLSRQARISAASMAALLASARNSRYWPEIASSVPIGGQDGTLRHRFVDLGTEARIRMKTGHLENVGAIAGWVTSRSGRSLSVVVLINHPGAQFGGGEAVIDTIVRWALDR